MGRTSGGGHSGKARRKMKEMNRKGRWRRLTKSNTNSFKFDI